MSPWAKIIWTLIVAAAVGDVGTDRAQGPSTRPAIETTSLPTFYADTSVENEFAIGFWDRTSGSFYRWKNVRLTKTQMPPFTPTLGIVVIRLKQPGITVVEVDRNRDYLLLPNGRVGSGYFDESLRRFYRCGTWSGDLGSIPAPGGKKPVILDPATVRLTVVDIECPDVRSKRDK